MGVHHEPQFPLEEGFRTAGFVVFPEQFARLQVKRGQKGPVARTEVQDDLPTMEDRGGAVCPIHCALHRGPFSKVPCRQSRSKDTGRAVPDHHARAVGDGS